MVKKHDLDAFSFITGSLGERIHQVGTLLFNMLNIQYHRTILLCTWMNEHLNMNVCGALCTVCSAVGFSLLSLSECTVSVSLVNISVHKCRQTGHNKILIVQQKGTKN